MDLTRRRTKHLSTLSTARLLSGVMILCAILLVLVAIVLPPWRDVILSRSEAGVATDIELLLLAIPVVEGWTILMLILSALLLAWCGYLLRVIAALVETQLTQFPTG
jgi:purine-cytosine permease-like protein